MKRRILALITGRVQGVWFRGSTQQQALQLGIWGSALNMHDGRVRVEAYGDEVAISRLIEWLHQGPELALVEEVTIEELDPTEPPPEGFATG